MNYLKLRLQSLKFEDYIYKIIVSIITLLPLEIAIVNKDFFTEDYFLRIDFLFKILCVFLVYIILLLFSNRKIDSYTFGIASVITGMLTAYEANDFLYTVGISIIVSGVIFYIYKDLGKIELSKRLSITMIAAFGVFMALFVGVVTSINYLRHLTPTYDMGIFSQMYYYMKETLQPLTTCERDGLLSHFAVHFSPIFYLLLPVYFIFPSPMTLLISQGILVSLGIIPLYKLCKYFKLSQKVSLLFCVIYALYPALIGANFFYFHENAFLPPLLLFLFYFAEKSNYKLSILFALLVLLVKEDAPVYVIFFALYLIFSRKNFKLGGILLSISLVYFIAVTSLMSVFGLGIMSYRYSNFIFGGKDSLVTVIINVIKNPAIVFYESFTAEKLKFLMYMLLPLGFLPVLIKKASSIILLFPMVLVNMMSDYGYQHNIGFQYTYASSVFLFYLAIINYSSFENNKTMKKIIISATAISFIFFSGTHLRKLDSIESYIDNKHKSEEIFSALSLVEQDKSVKASTFLVTPLSDRREVYEINYTDRQTDYVVLDLRYSLGNIKLEDYMNSEYQTIYYNKDLIAIFKRK